MTSKLHKQNTERIDDLEDVGKVDSVEARVLHWANNLEEIGRYMVKNFEGKEEKKLEENFRVALDYGRRLVKVKNRYKPKAEFAITRYNNLLTNGGVPERYQLGEQI